MSDEVSSEVSDESVAVEESAPQAEPVETAESQEAAPAPTQEEKQVPFHEHPRFKELIEQNRGFKDGLTQREQAIERMQQELHSLREQLKPKSEPPKDKFLEDLAKVDPAYAASIKPVYEQAQLVSKLQARLDQIEQQQTSKEVYGEFNRLLETNKVTDALDKRLYEQALTAEAYARRGRGENLSVKDLSNLFNNFHSEYRKAMEERERAITAKYVTAKKADVTPKGTTGGAATAPVGKKIAAGDLAGQAKWLANQIRDMKKTI